MMNGVKHVTTAQHASVSEPNKFEIILKMFDIGSQPSSDLEVNCSVEAAAGRKPALSA